MRTGALNTVQSGQIVFIESTAEGREGHFYDLCEEAQAKQRMGTPLTPLDFKFSFFPWFKCPDYAIEPKGVVIDDALARYFQKLQDTAGIELTANQKAWYVKKAATQLADMKREYPSTPEEAFEASPQAEGQARRAIAIERQRARRGRRSLEAAFDGRQCCGRCGSECNGMRDGESHRELRCRVHRTVERRRASWAQQHRRCVPHAPPRASAERPSALGCASGPSAP